MTCTFHRLFCNSSFNFKTIEPYVLVLILGTKTPETRNIVNNVLDAQGQKCRLDSSVIEILSDDDNDSNDDGDDYTDSHEDVNPGSSFSYPGIDIKFLKFSTFYSS